MGSVKHKDIASAEPESDELASALLAHSMDAVVICTTSGEIVWGNHAATELFGYSVAEMTKMNINAFDAALVEEGNVQGAIAKATRQEVNDSEMVFSDHDGRSFPVQVRMIPVVFRRQSRILCFVRDLSRLRKQEERLRQSNKMQAIGQLAGGIAHDFNNALGGIIGYGELAIEDAGENHIQKENLEKLLQAAERAKKLVKQILTFSRQNTPRKDSVFLSQLIAESIDFLRLSIPSSVMIEAALEKNVMPVAGDGTKIQEMLFNLVTNAVYAMDENGTLRIQLTQVGASEPFHGVVGDSPAGEYAVIYVEDNGCGIDPSIISHIFEPFYSTKHPDEGNGMGLSVVFGVVRSHGGNILIESSPGEGTRVRIYLPVTSMKTMSSPAPVTLPDEGNETLLVVDDEPLLVDICEKLLESLGYRVIATGDVNEALDILQDNTMRIDVLLTDQTMPQMKGAELASRAMQLRPGLPVVLCTGYSRSIDEAAAMQMGISCFIQKPVHKKDLAQAIRTALESRKEKKKQ